MKWSFSHLTTPINIRMYCHFIFNTLHYSSLVHCLWTHLVLSSTYFYNTYRFWNLPTALQRSLTLSSYYYVRWHCYKAGWKSCYQDKQIIWHEQSSGLNFWIYGQRSTWSQGLYRCWFVEPINPKKTNRNNSGGSVGKSYSHVHEG